MPPPAVIPAMNFGTEFPWDDPEAVGIDLTEVAFQWRWVNQYPFFTRIAKYPAVQQEYSMIGSSRRPGTLTVTAAATAADTVLTCADVSYMRNGDTLELTFADGTVEMMELVADPNEATAQVTVKRGDAFTLAGAIPAGTDLRIIANSRTGGEENQKGIAPRTWKRVNWIQNLDHPVEVSGLLQDTTAFRSNMISPGATTPLDSFRMNALRDMIRDFDNAIVYQRGMSPTDSNTKRAKTKGIRQLCQDAGSYIFQPTNYAAYSPRDFVRDVSEYTAQYGGAPDLYFVDRTWISGLAAWKLPLVKMDMGQTVFDVSIDGFRTNAAEGLFIIVPHFKPGTLFATREEDFMLRYMRLPTWYQRGKQGDTWKGDVIARVGVQMNYAEQSRFIEGITNFAAA